MSKLRITLTSKPNVIPVGAVIVLVKQPLNDFDSEAISVLYNNTPVGYVSATYKTRKKNTVSGGRIYDRFEKECGATVVADQVAEVDLP